MRALGQAVSKSHKPWKGDGRIRMLSDTDPKAEEVQLELIRRLTPGQRLARVRALTRETGERARRAIMKANPGLTE